SLRLLDDTFWVSPASPRLASVPSRSPRGPRKVLLRALRLAQAPRPGDRAWWRAAPVVPWAPRSKRPFACSVLLDVRFGGGLAGRSSNSLRSPRRRGVWAARFLCGLTAGGAYAPRAGVGPHVLRLIAGRLPLIGRPTSGRRRHLIYALLVPM